MRAIKIGSNYYTSGDGSTLQRISEADILARSNDTPIAQQIANGDITEYNPSTITLDKDGFLKAGGTYVNVGGSAIQLRNQAEAQALGINTNGANLQAGGSVATDNDLALSRQNQGRQYADNSGSGSPGSAGGASQPQYLRQKGTNEVYAITNGGSYYVSAADAAKIPNFFSQVQDVNYPVNQKYPISGSFSQLNQASSNAQPNNQNNQPGTDQASSTGNQQLDAVLSELQNYLKTLQQNGQSVNPNIVIDPSMIQSFLDQASKEISPYYGQQIQSIKNDLQANLSTLQQQYDLEQKQNEQNFQQSLESSREQNSGAGTIFSGTRNRGEQQAQNTEQNAIDQKRLSLFNTLGNSLRSSEQQIGSRNIQDLSLPQFNTPIASTTGIGSYTSGRSLDYFTPGSFTGSLEKDQATAIQNRANQLQQDYRQNRILDPNYKPS